MSIGSQSIRELEGTVSENPDISRDIITEWTERFSEMPDFDEELAVNFVNAVYQYLRLKKPAIKFIENPSEYPKITQPRLMSVQFAKVKRRLWMDLWMMYRKRIGQSRGTKFSGRDVEEGVRGVLPFNNAPEHFLRMKEQVVRDVYGRLVARGAARTNPFNPGHIRYTDEMIGWAMFYEFLISTDIIKPQKVYDDILKGTYSGIFFFLMLTNKCMVIKPAVKVSLNDEDRIHCGNGPAVLFDDGMEYFYLHGIPFDKNYYNKIIDLSMPAKEVLSIQNAEQRMAVIKELGYEYILDEVNAVVVDTYDGTSGITGEPVHYELVEFSIERGTTRPRNRFGNRMRLGGRVRFVKVEDHTTHKVVTLGVPIQSDTDTCLGAIAWTFGMSEEEYKPFIES